MITNNISWSLGATPNKSLASSAPSIPVHPSDLNKVSVAHCPCARSEPSPLFAKRTSFIGEQIRGGLGKPIPIHLPSGLISRQEKIHVHWFHRQVDSRSKLETSGQLLNALCASASAHFVYLFRSSHLQIFHSS